MKNKVRMIEKRKKRNVAKITEYERYVTYSMSKNLGIIGFFSEKKNHENYENRQPGTHKKTRGFVKLWFDFDCACSHGASE